MTEFESEPFDPDSVRPRKRGLARRALGTLGRKTWHTTKSTVRRTSRPVVLAAGGAVLTVGAIIGIKEMASNPSSVKDLFVDGVRNGEAIPGRIKETWDVWTQTKEQRDAKSLIENLEQLEQEGEIVVVRNVTVGQDGANMRNRPSPTAGLVGRLKPGEEIPVAIEVKGTIFTSYGEQEESANWYAFLDPENSDLVAFSFQNNFE